MDKLTKLLNSLLFLCLVVKNIQAQNCEAKCTTLLDGMELKTAEEKCVSYQHVAPMPTIFNTCIDGFLRTYKNACLNLCDSTNYPMVDYDCATAVRSASVSIKNGLKACKLGRQAATEWVTSVYIAEVAEEVAEVLEEVEELAKISNEEPEGEIEQVTEEINVIEEEIAEKEIEVEKIEERLEVEAEG
mmetsp:Transcript_31125/g.41169  ORF Transcript_31125/g.41169 Transcript_31125/m.41169 type:complete len:188 (-) Transcript_31125:26-589(-)